MPEIVSIAHEFFGVPLTEAEILVVWGHGWAQDGRCFQTIMAPFLRKAAHLALDFPGFGKSAMPPQHWGTKDYADAVADLIHTYKGSKKLLWVGHSFGCRVGLQLAAHHPDLVDGLFLIAGAGLPRKRGFFKTLSARLRVLTFKIMKRFVLLSGGDIEALRQKFGSADYKTAGALRPVFIRTVQENLVQEARSVRCPTCLVYGEKDTETPPEIGERLAKLIPSATLTVLRGQDHWSLLQGGAAFVQKRLDTFMGTM